VEYRQLGADGPRVSAVGFGGWAIGGHGYGEVDDAASIGAIRAAAEAGVNFFDTADVYGFGRSERVLADALGDDRHSAVIATKFGVCWDESGRTWRDASPERARDALEGSLKRLGVDRISLYQVHWPDGRTPLAATLEELVRQRDAGKIEFIGVSNFSAPEIASAGNAGAITSAQYHFNIVDRGSSTDINQCSELRVGVLAYSVLARGILSAKFDELHDFVPGDTRSTDPNFAGSALGRRQAVARALETIGDRRGATAAQVAIAWTLRQRGITTAIVGAKSAAQATANAAAAGISLTDSELDEIERVATNVAA
jgi:aryl-alcohol dehydrogenase-like predicted oxidoreductase